MNTVSLVGRLTSKPTLEENEEKKKVIINLAIPRDYKNSEGIYETDYIPCVLWNAIADRVSEWCEKGDCIGIRGRLQLVDNKLMTVVDKVQFISSAKVGE